jgi:hypothetical protein
MKTNQAAPLVGVVLGHAASPAKAASIASTYSKCPYCASFSSTGRSAMGIFALPQDRRWWLDRIADSPTDRLGLSDAEVLFTKAIDASSPWARGDVKPNLHPAPCGTDCRKCPCYDKECKGCPATLDYLGD